MAALIAIKNRYWLLILLVLLFVTRYYFNFMLKAPAMENAGRDYGITFWSFLVYNYLFGLILMLVFLMSNFLLLKGIAYLWQDLDSKKLLKSILISYCAFFIPSIISSLYFTLFNTDFHVSELGAFNRAFYLRAEYGLANYGEGSTLKSILSSINLMEFAYFAVIMVSLYFLFEEELSMKKIVPMVILVACVHFGSKTIIPLLMA